MMKKKDFINHINNNIAPFESGCKNVIVQLLPDQIEDSMDIGEGCKPICMNVFTLEKLRYDKEFIDSGLWDDYIPSRYLFSAELNRFDQEQYQNLLNSVDENNFASVRIKEYDYKPIQGEHVIKGSLEIVIGKRDNLEGVNVPFYTTACICWTDGAGAANGNGSLLSIAQGNISSINTEINDLSDELPHVDTGEDDGMVCGKVRIYNVGNGNMVAYLQMDGKRLIFDCGASFKRIGNTYTGVTQYDSTRNHVVKNVKPNYIVISHWHLDHYVYIDLFDKSQLQGIVIPNFNNIDYNFRITVQSFGKPIYDLSNQPYTKDMFSAFGFPNVKIYKGLGLPAPANGSLGVINYSGRNIDDEGLILSIGSGSYHRVILPGDCSYYSWPTEAELDLSNTCKLMVPHHGGHVIVKSTVTQNTHKYRCIYVSTGYLPPLRDLNNSKGNTTHGSFISSVYPHRGGYNSTDYHFTSGCSQVRPYCEINV